MDIGDTIHLSEIKLPEGVELPQLALGEDHDTAVVAIHAARAVVEEQPEAASAEGEAETTEASEES